MGGIGIGDAVPVILLEQTTLQERQTITGWAEARLSMVSDWGRQALGGLRLELQADTLDDESFLQICRQTGRLADLVDRLLTLERVDEAEVEARQAGDYDLLNLADLFDQHGHGSLAQTLLRERSQTSQDTRLPEWLKEYAKKQGNLPEALTLAERLFWLHPSVPAFVEIRQIATLQELWPELRTRILTSLIQQGQHTVLTEIYLEEGEIDKALEALEKAKANRRYLWEQPNQIRVAAAAREKRPRDAIRLYLEEAQHLIDRRGRENYAQAAEYLRQVQDLYRQMGEPQAWQETVTQLREQHRALRAFLDELRKAGL
jgi:uncharacterized Zn finger protein